MPPPWHAFYHCPKKKYFHFPPPITTKSRHRWDGEVGKCSVCVAGLDFFRFCLCGVYDFFDRKSRPQPAVWGSVCSFFPVERLEPPPPHTHRVVKKDPSPLSKWKRFRATWLCKNSKWIRASRNQVLTNLHCPYTLIIVTKWTFLNLVVFFATMKYKSRCQPPLFGSYSQRPFFSSPAHAIASTYGNGVSTPKSFGSDQENRFLHHFSWRYVEFWNLRRDLNQPEGVKRETLKSAQSLDIFQFVYVVSKWCMFDGRGGNSSCESCEGIASSCISQIFQQNVNPIFVIHLYSCCNRLL